MADTKTIIEALRNIATDYAEFGLTKEVLLEAADRLAKQQKRIRNQRREIEALAKDKKRVDGFVRWLDGEIRKCDANPNPLMYVDSSVRRNALVQSRRQLEKLRNGLGEKSRCELCDGYGGLAIKGPPNPYSSVVPCPRCNP